MIAKSRRLEVRQCKQGTLDTILTLPIHGRIIAMTALPAAQPNKPQCVFFLTERFQYALIGYDVTQTPYPVRTYASGSFPEGVTMGRTTEHPLLAMHPTCLALHLFRGFVTILPLQGNQLQRPFHVRVEQAHKILALCFLIMTTHEPQLCILYQSQAHQHVTSAKIVGQELHFQGIQSRVDGGSAILLPVPPLGQDTIGGVLVIGQMQWTYLHLNGTTKVVPIRQALFLCAATLPAQPLPRYLLADEFGNWHVLTLLVENEKIMALQRDVLGSCTLCHSLVVLEDGLVFAGSRVGDSQLLQIHPEPVEDAFLSVVEEYTQLGPILDLDSNGPVVVTASGSSQFGSLRLVRNGIGMNEYAAVEMPAIQNMFRLKVSENEDQYLVQSFVGETRVLGVVEREEGATLEEVWLAGLDSQSSSLYVGNVTGGAWIQITESAVRLCTAEAVLDTWVAEKPITVATANPAGQIAVALQGGLLQYLVVGDDSKLKVMTSKSLEKDVSCLTLDPLTSDAMETDSTVSAKLVGVGLWDEFKVRLLALDSLEESLCLELSEVYESEHDERHHRLNMMARSLCFITLELDSNRSVNVDMLFVGLGDGTLISFALSQGTGVVSAHSRKEVCLGTQRIDLVPLHTEEGGTCVLATGDRPTVIYLAGLSNNNPKLCYSNVNLSGSDEEDRSQQTIAVNVATPFVSPKIFETMGSQHYSLCVADDAYLRLGVIDDIQKLHVTTCRLGMAPRRIVHCPEGRLFAVGCLESGIKHLGVLQEDDEASMGNCIRILDDTTFDDLERIDLEPFEMILSMVYVSLQVGNETSPFLLVGTAYALPSEDEPTRGRILVYTCQPQENTTAATDDSRAIRPVAEFIASGAVYSLCQFYDGMALCTVGSKTMVCRLIREAGLFRFEFVGRGHHGNILSLFVKSLAKRTPTSDGLQDGENSKAPATLMDVSEHNESKGESKEEEQFAIVGDLMRSISLVQYYPEHKTLEEIARDFNSNWTTAIEMLHANVYLGAENWNNLFCLRRNTASTSAEVQCRLETVGEYHLGEMCNKFLPGSLVMPVSSSKSKQRTTPESPSKANRAAARKPPVVTGSQTLFGTVDGTLGVILGLDGKTAAFFSCLERAMSSTIQPVGDLEHRMFRAVQANHRVHPAHGFIDGDLIESFLDLDQTLMEKVVTAMNRDGGWEADDEDAAMMPVRESGESENDHMDLSVDDVVTMVEEMTMLH